MDSFDTAFEMSGRVITIEKLKVIILKMLEYSQTQTSKPHKEINALINEKAVNFSKPDHSKIPV